MTPNINWNAFIDLENVFVDLKNSWLLLRNSPLLPFELRSNSFHSVFEELFDYRFENIVACFKSSTRHDVRPWEGSRYPCPHAKGTAHWICVAVWCRCLDRCVKRRVSASLLLRCFLVPVRKANCLLFKLQLNRPDFFLQMWASLTTVNKCLTAVCLFWINNVSRVLKWPI